MVVFTSLTTLSAAFAFIYFFPPVYKSGVKLLIETEDTYSRGQFNDRWNVFRFMREVETESALIRVGPVAAAVVDELGLKYDDVYHSIFRTIIDLWKESYVGRRYRALKKRVFSGPAGPEALTEAEIERYMTIDDFISGVQIEGEPNSNVIEVIVLGPSPRVAEMANTLVDVYLRQRDDRRRAEAMAAYHALSPQVDRAHGELADSERIFQEFLDQHGIKFDFDKERNDVLVWGGHESALLETRAKAREAAARLEEIDRQLAGEPLKEITTRETSLNQLKIKMRNELLVEELKLIELSKRFTPEAPEIAEVNGSISKLEEKILNSDEYLLSSSVETDNPVWRYLQLERSRIRITIGELEALETAQEKIVDRFQEDLSDLPEKQRKFGALERDVALNEREYEELLEKHRQAFVSGTTDVRALDSVRVVERAVPPGSPLRPRAKLYILAALVSGMLMGCGAAFVAGFFDETIRVSDDLESLFGVSVYGRISISGLKSDD